jgi:predicted nucleic acid-binding protein
VIVVDASAIVDLILPATPDPVLRDRLLSDGNLHAPHVVDVEVVSALRRSVRHGRLSPERAADARVDLAATPIVRYPHEPLLARAWDLRDTLTVYDGVYVALAELLDAPLVTSDARLAAATGHDAEIELFAPD